MLRALDRAGIATRHPVEVVAWTNEEGSRFAPGAGARVRSSIPRCSRLPRIARRRRHPVWRCAG
ncbi:MULTISPECIES: hypothetical protein [unclassified Paraburkholderia]|uniref:hypothetical protein n=1 Tax=unclassified Paraburkholderia TaxID=2615204 RepID=UPI0039063F51